MYSFVDSHCDTITTLIEKKQSLNINDCHIDLKKYAKYESPVQFFAIWLEPFFYPRALEKTLLAIEFYFKELDENKSLIAHINTYDDILQNKKNGKISALLSIEGGEGLVGNPELLDVYYRLGVRAMTLTWNHKNHIGVGAEENNRNEGLSEIGFEVVKKMNKLGMIVDVSHLSDKGFDDVSKIMDRPFIASHSNSRFVCNRDRNLTDGQIRAIAEKNGVIGINFFPYFINNTSSCNIDEIMYHIRHMLKLVGEDYIGIGSDFDGISCTPEGLGDMSKMEDFIQAIERNFGEKIATKISSTNYLRVVKEILG